MARVRLACLLPALAALVVHALPARAAEWGNIIPGETTMDAVRQHYGEPSSSARKKLDRYDSTEWIYEGDRAPGGMLRMIVQFGILKAAKYVPSVVRTFGLEPKPGIFTRAEVTLSWGKPQKGGMQDGTPTFIYEDGLVVYFDKDVVNAQSIWFTVPRPPAPPADKVPASSEKPTPAPREPKPSR